MERRGKLALTPELAHQIVSAIRGGGYPHVAAEAAGVSRRVFRRWLKRSREPYASFARDVRQARAQARLKAEVAAFQSAPKNWLEHGPGKEKPGDPGWTGVVPAGTDAAEFDVFADAAAMRLCRLVLAALLEFPEARVKLSRVVLQEAEEKGDRLLLRLFPPEFIQCN